MAGTNLDAGTWLVIGLLFFVALGGLLGLVLGRGVKSFPLFDALIGVSVLSGSIVLTQLIFPKMRTSSSPVILWAMLAASGLAGFGLGISSAEQAAAGKAPSRRPWIVLQGVGIAWGIVCFGLAIALRDDPGSWGSFLFCAGLILAGSVARRRRPVPPPFGREEGPRGSGGTRD